LEPTYQLRLLLRRELGVVLSEPERLGDDAARLRVITGEEDDVAHVASFQRADGVPGLGTELVLQDQEPGQCAVDGDERRRAAHPVSGARVGTGGRQPYAA